MIYSRDAPFWLETLEMQAHVLLPKLQYVSNTGGSEIQLSLFFRFVKTAQQTQSAK